MVKAQNLVISTNNSVCALRVQNAAQFGARSCAPLNVLRIPSLRLDSYLDGKRKVDLVKIDVEGAGLMVFRGASALHALPKDQSPTVILEYDSNNYARFGYRAGDLFDLLRRNGYGI